MGDPQVITFSYKELATVLIKHQGIHEGLWPALSKWVLMLQL